MVMVLVRIRVMVIVRGLWLGLGSCAMVRVSAPQHRGSPVGGEGGASSYSRRNVMVVLAPIHVHVFVGLGLG